MTLQRATVTPEQGHAVQVPVRVNSSTTMIDIQEQPHIAWGDIFEKIDVILLHPEGDAGREVFKWYWRPSGEGRLHPVHHLFRFVASEEQLGLSGCTAASTTLWSEPKQCPEPDTKAWRGVFSPPYHRKTLFSQSVEFRTADLPKWKPHITIDRRTLARTEDE